MKNSLLVFFLLLSILFFSCKNASDSKLTYSEVDTIKEYVSQKEANVSWTKELEPNILDENLSLYSEKVSGTVILEPEVFKILKNYKEDIYPEFEDFGKLDSRKIPFSIKEKINNFTQALNSNIYSGPESSFNSKYVFNYVFFVNDLKEGWKNAFSVPFPYSVEDTKKELKTSDESDKNDQIFKYQLFSKILYGEPFIGEKIIQIPMRLYCNEGAVDVTLFINQNSNDIYQITIDRWNKI